MKAAIYIRSNGDKDIIVSKTVTQLFRLYVYAIDKGYSVSLKHIYADTGSANNYERIGLNNMLEDAEFNEFSKVLVTSYDRIARRQSAMTAIHEDLQYSNVDIEVVH